MTAGESEETAALLDGRYRLGECVGEGGMARVYRAEDVALGRTVAIKLIRPGVDGASSERARSEMTVLASLNHPSLVTLFDARLIPGQPEYLVMEFVDGPTLSSQLAGGPLPPDAVAHLGAELAEALHVVHQAGVVHRDIKPSNVLLSPAQLPGSRPRAKLADFGIAYLLDASRLTSPGLVVGTVAYLAPEQIRGGEPAPESDIYSLGLVLLEALTGERAHPHGGGMAAAVARVENPPAIPAALDLRWRELLTRMLDAEPQNRPTAAEVATAAGALTDPAGAVDTSAPGTTATVPLTAATLVAPAAGALVGGAAAASAGASPVPVASAGGGSSVRGGRPTRLLAVIGGALAAVAVVIAVVIGAVAPGGSPDTPAPVPAVTEPSDSPPPAEDTGNDTVVDDPGMTKEERKAAEEARKEAEEAQKKLEEEQRKQAEEEQKRLEEQQEQDDDDQGDD